jgi:hypothetical protein
MKRGVCGLIGSAALVLILGACESLPFNYYLCKSWSAPGEAAGVLPARVHLVSVSVDRTGGWASVEKEIRGLAPLLFFDQGCRLVSSGEDTDFYADIRAREREYAAGWQTKRSLAVEVRLWPAGAGEPGPQELAVRPADEPADEPALPLTAGRVTALGNRSFSSSETTGRMLALAIKKAVKPLKVTARPATPAGPQRAEDR